MIQREAGIVELIERIKAAQVELTLNTVRRLPTRAFELADFPALAIYEGDDTLISHQKNKWNSYPAVREFVIAIEIWDDTRPKVMALYQAVRNLIFNTKFAGITFTEQKAHGPYNQGVPNTYGMQLMLVMQYMDAGPNVT